MKYDSERDTKKHILTVRKYINEFITELNERAKKHDKSKLEEPEKSIFDKYTPKLKNTEYGSKQYNAYLKEMEKALKHHYENNRHHPEHFKYGIKGMTLVDIVEMYCDWKAASERHKNGDFIKSLWIQKNRFNLGVLFNIFMNTAIKEHK